MKQRLLAIVALCVVAGAGLYFNRARKPATEGQGAPAPEQSVVSFSRDTPPTVAQMPVEVKAAANPTATEPESPTTAGLVAMPVVTAGRPTTASTVTGPDGVAGMTVMENMRGCLREYSQIFGGNPVGTNPEITKALNGANAKQVNFIRTDSGLRVNGNGELIDPWGTPFFFHQISGKQMEIRSAGPDRKMWTADDLLTN